MPHPMSAHSLKTFQKFIQKNKMRGTSIEAVVMIDSQIDHATGLFVLREGNPLTVYCTNVVKQDLTTEFLIFNILEHFCGVMVDGTFWTDDELSSAGPPLLVKKMFIYPSLAKAT